MGWNTISWGYWTSFGFHGDSHTVHSETYCTNSYRLPQAVLYLKVPLAVRPYEMMMERKADSECVQIPRAATTWTRHIKVCVFTKNWECNNMKDLFTESLLKWTLWWNVCYCYVSLRETLDVARSQILLDLIGLCIKTMLQFIDRVAVVAVALKCSLRV